MANIKVNNYEQDFKNNWFSTYLYLNIIIKKIYVIKSNEILLALKFLIRLYVKRKLVVGVKADCRTRDLGL